MSALQALPPKREVPGLRWWGGVVSNGTAAPRLVIRWPRIFLALGILGVATWLGLATALWGFYRFKQDIPAVAWTDVVTGQFRRMQDAIGAHYFAQAKTAWEHREFARGLMLGRAAVRKAPDDLEARLFLGGLWVQVRRPDEALRVYAEGAAKHGRDPRLQRAYLETAFAAGKPTAVLTWLRTELPARGSNPLRDGAMDARVAEVRALLDTAGGAAAEAQAAKYPELNDAPLAAPLLARIDIELGRNDAAWRRVLAAREREPERPEFHEAVIDVAQRTSRIAEARTAAGEFHRRFPESLSAHLRFLELHDLRTKNEETDWTAGVLRFLVRYRRNPAALERLADLAARRGWSEITYLLYQHSLQETLGSFPFALHHIGSLTKRGEYATAERMLRELAAEPSAAYTAASSAVAYLTAMVEWGQGREQEAQRYLDQLKLEVATDPRRLKSYQQVFRALGFEILAEKLAVMVTPAAPATAGS